MYDAFPEGPRVLVTRAAEDASALAEALAAIGCQPVVVPVLERRWLPFAVSDLAERVPDADWVLVTSAATAEVLAIAAPLAWPRARIAAVGPATEQRVVALGLSKARILVPERATAADLVRALGDLRGKIVVYPRADLAPQQTVDALTNAGATVHSVIAYENTGPSGYAGRLRDALPVQVTTLMSSSAAERVASAIAETDRYLLGSIVVIGPSTEAAAHAHGLRVHAVARPHSLQGLTAAVSLLLQATEP